MAKISAKDETLAEIKIECLFNPVSSWVTLLFVKIVFHKYFNFKNLIFATQLMFAQGNTYFSSSLVYNPSFQHIW